MRLLPNCPVRDNGALCDFTKWPLPELHILEPAFWQKRNKPGQWRTAFFCCPKRVQRWNPSFTARELLRCKLDCGREMERREPPTAAARHKCRLHLVQLRLDVRRQLPSSSLKGGFDVCQNVQHFSFLFGCPCTAQLARKKCIFLSLAVLCPQVASVFFPSW